MCWQVHSKLQATSASAIPASPACNLCPSMQRFLRVIQAGLHLIQLQLGVDAFAFSLLLLKLTN
jgi:hypothetical protein